MARVKKAKKRADPPSYGDAVRTLARDHARDDKGIREIWSFDDPSGEALRFVEVYDEQLPAENGVVQAVVFGRSPESPYALEIALLSRADWDRVQKGTLKLPEHWAGSPGRRVKG